MLKNQSISVAFHRVKVQLDLNRMTSAPGYFIFQIFRLLAEFACEVSDGGVGKDDVMQTAFTTQTSTQRGGMQACLLPS